MELLDIRDIEGRCTGKVKERSAVHRDGDIHGASHIFVTRYGESGVELLLQKRSAKKDSYPGCYDISAAGHLPAGEDYLEAALRELEEELGIKAKEEDLIYVGCYEVNSNDIFYGQPFLNHELCKMYLYEKNVDIEKLTLQEEEVESVKWMSLEDCLTKAREGDKDYCLLEEGLLLVKNYYNEE